jgi:enoyl-CoA hydratase
MDDIIVRDEGSVFRIQLNRPDHGNSVTDEMAAEIIRLLERASQTARLAVVSGAGRDYCVGRAMMGKAPPQVRPEALVRRRQNDLVFHCYGAFRRSRIPILSVVRGRAAGFGCALAALSDITIASDTSSFQIPEMEHNIMPTMVMSAMVDRISAKALNYLVYTSKTISAERALSFGLVSDIAPEAELDGLANEICAAILKAPVPATEGVKEYVRSAFSMPISGAVDYARNLHATINSSSEMKPKPAQG